MTIGITINNLLRDHITSLRNFYTIVTDLEPIEPINPFDLEASFPTKIVEATTVSEFKENEETDMVEHEQADESFDVYEAMYQDASFEIFGRADESEDGILRKLKDMEKELKVKFVLLNKESPRSKCATLFFLSKNFFDFEKVQFPEKDKHFYRGIDVLVTDNPKILAVKPKNRKTIKVANDFNIDSPSDYTIINLDDLKQIILDIKNAKK